MSEICTKRKRIEELLYIDSSNLHKRPKIENVTSEPITDEKRRADSECYMDMDITHFSESECTSQRNTMDGISDGNHAQGRSTENITPFMKSSRFVDNFRRGNYAKDDDDDDGVFTDYEDVSERSQKDRFYDYESLYSENTLDAISDFHSDDEY